MPWILDHREVMGRAIEDAQAVLKVKGGLRDPLAFVARLGDLTRSTNFLWVEAYFKMLERYSRVTHIGRQSSRELTLGTLAADILTGYMILDQRARWSSSHLVRPEDWELQHERSANRILDSAAALGGTLIKACPGHHIFSGKTYAKTAVPGQYSTCPGTAVCLKSSS
jgi:hypothetical protein